MASVGQTGTHAPQPLQPAASIRATVVPSPSNSEMAAKGQAPTQSPQPVQAAAVTVATWGSSSATPRLSTAATWVTAARPEVTLSAEVFGPWQVPQIITPSTTVST